MSESDTPDGPRSEEPEVTPEEIPAEAADVPVPDAEAPAPDADAPAPDAEEPATQAGAAPTDPEPEPAPSSDPAPASESPEPEPAPAAASAATESPAEEEDDDEDVAPRARPEIPGADLVPDLVADGDEYLDAEARAAAEAEAEAAAARAAEEGSDEHSEPIAEVAIDLASGARYVATGKRKTAVARVILKPGTGTYLINDKQIDDFFPRPTLQRIIRQPLETVGYEQRMDVIARMHGGGVAAQAGALRHGISRALLEADPNLRGELKRRGFLTRDPRVKERKKAGLKKARKRPQFSKR